MTSFVVDKDGIKEGVYDRFVFQMCLTLYMIKEIDLDIIKELDKFTKIIRNKRYSKLWNLSIKLDELTNKFKIKDSNESFFCIFQLLDNIKKECHYNKILNNYIAHINSIRIIENN